MRQLTGIFGFSTVVFLAVFVRKFNKKSQLTNVLVDPILFKYPSSQFRCARGWRCLGNDLLFSAMWPCSLRGGCRQKKFTSYWRVFTVFDRMDRIDGQNVRTKPRIKIKNTISTNCASIHWPIQGKVKNNDIFFSQNFSGFSVTVGYEFFFDNLFGDLLTFWLFFDIFGNFWTFWVFFEIFGHFGYFLTFVSIFDIFGDFWHFGYFFFNIFGDFFDILGIFWHFWRFLDILVIFWHLLRFLTFWLFFCHFWRFFDILVIFWHFWRFLNIFRDFCNFLRFLPFWRFFDIFRDFWHFFTINDIFTMFDIVINHMIFDIFS